MGPEFEVYSLFVSSDDFRLELNMLDTILFRDGLPVLWLFTNKDGKVMRKKDTNTTLAKARDYFLKKALEDTKVNYTKTVCSYSADTPDAATMDGVEFARFMDYLAKVKTVDEQLPCCIHLFKKPCFDMWYASSIHTVQTYTRKRSSLLSHLLHTQLRTLVFQSFLYFQFSIVFLLLYITHCT